LPFFSFAVPPYPKKSKAAQKKNHFFSDRNTISKSDAKRKIFPKGVEKIPFQWHIAHPDEPRMRIAKQIVLKKRKFPVRQ